MYLTTFMRTKNMKQSFLKSLLAKLESNSFLVFVLFTLAALTILVNAPGHITSDPIYQLKEGRTNNFLSIHPPFMSFMLGILDKIYPGYILFFLINISIFYFSIYLLLKDNFEYRKTTLMVLIAICLSPIILIYNGIVWKDILFANLALLGFSLLSRERMNIGLVLLTALTFAAIVLVRQQGFLVVACGAFCFALREPGLKKTMRVFRFVGSLLLIFALSKLIFLMIIINGAKIFDPTFRSGLTSVLLYDVSGIAYMQGPAILTEFAKAGVNISDYMAIVIQSYSDSRIDFMQFGSTTYAVFDWNVLTAQWLHAVKEYPMSYLIHRLNVFSWLMGFQDHTQCLPLALGIDGPIAIISELRLERINYPYKSALWNYAKTFFHTPLYMPWFYALIGGIALHSLAKKFALPKERALFMLLVSAFMYVGSYFFFSIACDFRYTYLLVLASTITILILAPNWLGHKLNLQ